MRKLHYHKLLFDEWTGPKLVYSSCSILSHLLHCATAIAMRYLPKPGEGPTKEQQLNGMFQYRFVAETEEKEGSPSSIVQAVLRCEGHDPGYWGTSLMVLECALCQVLEKERLKEESLADGGVLTPAAAFGMVAIDRLIKAGFSIKIVE